MNKIVHAPGKGLYIFECSGQLGVAFTHAVK
jgi:hypothetical protein